MEEATANAISVKPLLAVDVGGTYLVGIRVLLIEVKNSVRRECQTVVEIIIISFDPVTHGQNLYSSSILLFDFN